MHDPPTQPSKADTAFARLWNAGFFRQFVESSDDLVVIVDTDGAFAYLNAAAQRMLGRPGDELLGQRAFDYVYGRDRRATVETFTDWLQSGSSEPGSLENRLRTPNGDVRTVLWTVQPCCAEDQQVIGFAATGRDVSELREQQASLSRRELHYRALLAGMLDAVVTTDVFGTILDASDSVLETFGWEPDDLRGRNVDVLMPEPHHSQHDDYLARYRETGETWILGTTREFTCVRRDGYPIQCELSVSRIDIPGFEDPIFCGSFRDVTARQVAEQALAESERRFRAIFDQEFQFVGLLRPDGSILEANQAALQAGRLERDEVVGRPFWEPAWWPNAATRERVKLAVREAAGGLFVRFEIQMQSSLRGLRTVDFSLKPLRNERGEVTLLLPEGRDITQLKRAQHRETAMLRAFAEIGESASVLAHEIKNPITAVNMALRAVSEQLGEDHQATLSDLVASLRKVETLMRRTLSFTRPLELEIGECHVGELVERTVTEARAMAAERQATLATNIADVPVIHADPTLIGQALTNIVHNAIDAIDEGGRVEVWCHGDRNGVRFGVDDDGPGIPEALREEVFRPFVTTRAAGTGLGLPLTRKMIEAHGGRIELKTSRLGGARVECTLPLNPQGSTSC